MLLCSKDQISKYESKAHRQKRAAKRDKSTWLNCQGKENWTLIFIILNEHASGIRPFENKVI